MVFPGISGHPSVTIRRGSPAAWDSIVLSLVQLAGGFQWVSTIFLLVPRGPGKYWFVFKEGVVDLSFVQIREVV
jgi:hypothetical protein